MHWLGALDVLRIFAGGEARASEEFPKLAGARSQPVTALRAAPECLRLGVLLADLIHHPHLPAPDSGGPGVLFVDDRIAGGSVNHPDADGVLAAVIADAGIANRTLDADDQAVLDWNVICTLTVNESYVLPERLTSLAVLW